MMFLPVPVPATMVHVSLVLATVTVGLVHSRPLMVTEPPAAPLSWFAPMGPKLVPVTVTVPPAVEAGVAETTVGSW